MWTDLVIDSTILKSIFTNEEVSLDKVVLHKIDIDCINGWYFKIEVDLSIFPSQPPIKWFQRKYNTARISFGFIESQIECLRNSEVEIITGNLSFDAIGDKSLVVVFTSEKNNEIIFQLRCKWINIISLTGYINSTTLSKEYQNHINTP